VILFFYMCFSVHFYTLMNNGVTPTNAQYFLKYDIFTLLPTCLGLNKHQDNSSVKLWPV
jgi:hypothetical protein